MERPTVLEKAILKHGLGVFTSKPNSKAHVQRTHEAHKNFRVGLSRGWTRDESIRYALSIAARGEGYKYRTAKYQEALKASSLGDITSISQLVDWTRRATTHRSYTEAKIVCDKPPLMLLWQRAVKAILGDCPSTPCEYESI